MYYLLNGDNTFTKTKILSFGELNPGQFAKDIINTIVGDELGKHYNDVNNAAINAQNQKKRPAAITNNKLIMVSLTLKPTKTKDILNE